jgi:hypothetical protein
MSTPVAWSWISNILIPNLSYDGYREIPEGKQPESDDNHATYLAPRLKKEYNYLYFLSRASGLGIGDIYITFNRKLKKVEIWAVYSVLKPCGVHFVSAK